MLEAIGKNGSLRVEDETTVVSGEYGGLKGHEKLHVSPIAWNQQSAAVQLEGVGGRSQKTWEQDRETFVKQGGKGGRTNPVE